MWEHWVAGMGQNIAPLNMINRYLLLFVLLNSHCMSSWLPVHEWIMMISEPDAISCLMRCMCLNSCYDLYCQICWSFHLRKWSSVNVIWNWPSATLTNFISFYQCWIPVFLLRRWMNWTKQSLLQQKIPLGMVLMKVSLIEEEDGPAMPELKYSWFCWCHMYILLVLSSLK